MRRSLASKPAPSSVNTDHQPIGFALYGFGLDEIVHNDMPDMEHDPKLAWAYAIARHFTDLNKADKLLLLRVLDWEHARYKKFWLFDVTQSQLVRSHKMRLPLQKLKPSSR